MDTVFRLNLIICWKRLSSDRHVSRRGDGKCPVTHGTFVTDSSIYLQKYGLYFLNPVSDLIFNQ